MAGFFVGASIPFNVVKAIAICLWENLGLYEVFALKDLFYFRCTTSEDAYNIITKGTWMIGKQMIILQQWHSDHVFSRENVWKTPTWICLHQLSLHLWGMHGLSVSASVVGKPLACDKFTTQGSRIGFARICVLLDAMKAPPKSFLVQSPGSDDIEVHVEYEWLPKKM